MSETTATIVRHNLFIDNMLCPKNHSFPGGMSECCEFDFGRLKRCVVVTPFNVYTNRNTLFYGEASIDSQQNIS